MRTEERAGLRRRGDVSRAARNRRYRLNACGRNAAPPAIFAYLETVRDVARLVNVCILEMRLAGDEVASQASWRSPHCGCSIATSMPALFPAARLRNVVEDADMRSWRAARRVASLGVLDTYPHASLDETHLSTGSAEAESAA